MLITREQKIELLAEYAHNAWSGWMEYLFSQSKIKVDGSAVIPAWAVERWKRQLKTKYAHLPYMEKDSDRVEAERILKILEGC